MKTNAQSEIIDIKPVSLLTALDVQQVLTLIQTKRHNIGLG